VAVDEADAGSADAAILAACASSHEKVLGNTHNGTFWSELVRRGGSRVAYSLNRQALIDKYASASAANRLLLIHECVTRAKPQLVRSLFGPVSTSSPFVPDGWPELRKQLALGARGVFLVIFPTFTRLVNFIYTDVEEPGIEGQENDAPPMLWCCSAKWRSDANGRGAALTLWDACGRRALPGRLVERLARYNPSTHVLMLLLCCGETNGPSSAPLIWFEAPIAEANHPTFSCSTIHALDVLCSDAVVISGRPACHSSELDQLWPAPILSASEKAGGRKFGWEDVLDPREHSHPLGVVRDGRPGVEVAAAAAAADVAPAHLPAAMEVVDSPPKHVVGRSAKRRQARSRQAHRRAAASGISVASDGELQHIVSQFLEAEPGEM